MQKKFRLTPVRLLVLGYLCVIVLGTVLLVLPVSSRPDGGATFMDALFTTVSASCVKLLTVRLLMAVSIPETSICSPS